MTYESWRTRRCPDCVRALPAVTSAVMQAGPWETAAPFDAHMTAPFGAHITAPFGAQISLSQDLPLGMKCGMMMVGMNLCCYSLAPNTTSQSYSSSQAGGSFVEVRVGEKPAWKSPDHPFRLDPTLKLTGESGLDGLCGQSRTNPQILNHLQHLWHWLSAPMFRYYFHSFRYPNTLPMDGQRPG